MNRACLFLLLLAPPALAQSPAISRVGWLQGCWSSVSPQRVIDEQWMAPRGRSMLGMGRTVRGDSLVEFELVVIREGAATLVYEAHPSGQAPDTFTATLVSDTAVLFENPAHDFPQKVGYRRVGTDSVTGYIEGTRGGRSRRIEFPYARAHCGASPTPARERGTRGLTQDERAALLRDLESRRTAWRARRITGYRLQVAVGCFCPWPSHPAVLEVRGGVVTALRDTTGKSLGAPREPWSRYTVDSLFAAVEHGVQQLDVIEVAYDSEYGYPAMIQGNGRVGPDNWFWVKASRLTPFR